jgi:hypothetical protein
VPVGVAEPLGAEAGAPRAAAPDPHVDLAATVAELCVGVEVCAAGVAPTDVDVGCTPAETGAAEPEETQSSAEESAVGHGWDIMLDVAGGESGCGADAATGIGVGSGGGGLVAHAPAPNIASASVVMAMRLDDGTMSGPTSWPTSSGRAPERRHQCHRCP